MRAICDRQTKRERTIAKLSQGEIIRFVATAQHEMCVYTSRVDERGGPPAP